MTLSTLAWKIPWTEEPGGLQSRSRKESDTTARFHFHLSLSCIGEGSGNPLQYSCLENPRDEGVWWASFCGVAQSRTRLKRLSSSSNPPKRISDPSHWQPTMGQDSHNKSCLLPNLNISLLAKNVSKNNFHIWNAYHMPRSVLINVMCINIISSL